MMHLRESSLTLPRWAYSEDRRQTAYATFFTGTTFEPVSGQRWNPGESFIRDRGNRGLPTPVFHAAKLSVGQSVAALMPKCYTGGGSTPQAALFERPTGPLPAMSGVTVRDRSGLSGDRKALGLRRDEEPRSAGRSKPWNNREDAYAPTRSTALSRR